MRKILLVLGLVSVPFFGQVISFEASEGYNLGDINGQKNWISTPYTSGGNVPDQVVTNEQASDGTQSFKISKIEGTPKQQFPIIGGYYKLEPVISPTDYKISFDVFFNSIGTDTYLFSPQDSETKLYTTLIFVTNTGNLQVVQNNSLVNTNITFQAQKWYSVAYKHNSGGIDVYVDGQKIGTSTILHNGNIDQATFIHNNAGGSAYIDNIRFGSDATFSVGDIATKEELRVYPNPVKDFLNIDVTSTEKIKSISIFSVDGRSSVLTFDNNKADFSNLPTGVYVLQVETDSQTYTRKVIKK